MTRPRALLAAALALSGSCVAADECQLLDNDGRLLDGGTYSCQLVADHLRRGSDDCWTFDGWGDDTSLTVGTYCTGDGPSYPPRT